MITYDKAAAENIERSYKTPDIAKQRLRTLDALALKAGDHVLDVGCGNGFLTAKIAALVGEQGHVKGIDNSSDMLSAGHERCKHLTQVSLKEGSVTQLPEEDNHYDAVTCIQTLLYVDDVNTALDELYRVTKPGGKIAIVETDWSGLVVNDSDAVLTQRIITAWTNAVPNPKLPPVLNQLLTRAGFAAIRVEAIPIINTCKSDAGFSGNALEWLADIAYEQSLISRNEHVLWLADLQDKANQDAYFFCINRFLFTAVKV